MSCLGETLEIIEARQRSVCQESKGRGKRMTKFRKKPVEIEASQWFKNGDHPKDEATEMFDYPNGSRPQAIREGKIVRYFRRPDVSGDSGCEHCNQSMHIHGWIDTLEGGHIVCPGDWIITGVKGENYPCKPDIFAATYDAVGDREGDATPQTVA